MERWKRWYGEESERNLERLGNVQALTRESRERRRMVRMGIRAIVC